MALIWSEFALYLILIKIGWKKLLLSWLFLPFYLAAFKIVKNWLGPEAATLLKLTNKNEIQEYITAEYLPPYMGGTVSMQLCNYYNVYEKTINNYNKGIITFLVYSLNIFDIELQSLMGKQTFCSIFIIFYFFMSMNAFFDLRFFKKALIS